MKQMPDTADAADQNKADGKKHSANQHGALPSSSPHPAPSCLFFPLLCGFDS